MRKIIFSLFAALCLVSLAACGNQVEEEPLMQGDVAEKVGIAVAQYLVADVSAGEEEDFKRQFYAGGTFNSVGIGLTGTEVADKAVDSLKSAIEDTGDISYADITSATVSITPERADISVDLDGELKDAKMEISIEGNKFEGYSISNIATNVDYTMGEKMTMAFLNLLLGMGMAFSVLILISLVISLLPRIDRAISGMQKKKAEKNAPAPAPSAAPAPAAAAPVAAPAPTSDDDVIAAVIAAAVAQYESENGVPAGGYYVRSIRRARR